MKKSLLTLTLTFYFVSTLLAQFKGNNNKQYKNLFDSSEVFLLVEDYKSALPLCIRLNEMNPCANNQFKIGFCYLNSPTFKTKSIPYFEKAINDVSSKYKEESINETRAPIYCIYSLAKSYQLNYEFDKAVQFYNQYKDSLDATDPNLQSDIEDINLEIESCKYAIELVKKPVKANITNMGVNINSAYADFSPVISLDELTLIFTTRRPNFKPEKETNGDYFEDIFIAQQKSEKWQPAKSIGDSINTKEHEAAVNLSADGRNLLIYRDIAGNGNLYLSELEGDTWSAPKELVAPINSTAWESHACISADNKYLYFVSNRDGGVGGKDIYKCLRLPNGEWGPPQNIGPEINTKYDEDGVFIHPDGKQIFFSSKGHKSMGGYDIFTSIINDENGFWSTPVNIGYPINTPDDDIFYVTSADGTRAYFSSDKEGGYGEKDIYLITYPEYEERHITVLIGKVVNKTQLDISNNQIYIIEKSTNDTVQTLIANSKSGKYGANLPIGKEYKTVYRVNNRVIFEETLDATKKEGYKVITREVPYVSDSVPQKVVPIENKYVCDPKGASMIHYFIYNELQLIKSPEFIAFIDATTNCYKANENFVINIETSASKVPTTTFKDNMLLAKYRANDAEKNITQALIKNGVKKEKIKYSTHKCSVNGPEYKNDFDKNDKIYEQYQYTKVSISVK